MYTAFFCCRNVSFMLKINMVVLFVLVSILSAWLKTASAESEEADPCQGRVGIFPNPDDCTTYLICQNGVSEIANCPDGLLFDRYKRTCDRNVTVDCSDAGASDLPPYQTGVRSDDVVCESDNCSCIYPSRTSCSQYYRCEDGIAYLEQCSEGLLMNPETLTCDYAEDVSCAVSAEVEQEDPCQGKVGVFSNPDDCTTYLICQNGISEIVSCPDGLLFDRYKRTCDRNATVACSDAGATDLPPYQTGVRSDDVVCESNNCSCIYPSNTSCSQYYRCEHGIAYVEQCSEGLLMNPETLTCDYAEDVTCDISPSYDTSSPTITAYYLSSGSDLEDDNEILSFTTEEEINDESKESTLYPTSEVSVIGQSTFMDENTGTDFDENERRTTMILTSEAEFSGNTIGDDAVKPSESYSLPDSTDGMALTGIPGNGTISQPSTTMPDNITSEDGTSTSFAQTERDLLTTVISTVTKYFFSDKASETTSQTFPATKEETSENDLKTDVQPVSTSGSITFTSMPYKTPVNAESTLSVSSTLSPAITGESTVTEISSAIITGESESYFDSEKTSSENGQITEQHLTPESKSTLIDDASESTILTSPIEFIKPEDNFAQETISSGITDSSVKSTSPISVVYRSTDSELSFDDTTANDNSVYTKDSSTISHDIVELSTLHINQTQKKNPNEIKDASNLPVNFNVTTTPEETSTGTTADEGRFEIPTESEIMTNVPSLEITDSSEKEHFGTDAINETADNVFDITTNFIDLTSETQNPFATSETYVTKLTSPSKETSQTNTTGSQDTSTYSDLVDSKPTSVTFTTESIASTGANDDNTETATLQTVSEIRNHTITSDSASSSPTVSFTSETASELSTATENKVQYTSTDIDKETKEMESIATNIISTTAGHIDLTPKFTEISSETPAPTTTFATKFTALPVRSSSFSTGSETEISTNTRTEAFTSETASENPTEKTRVSDSVSNLRTEPFTSETAPKRSIVNEITEYTMPTEADIISSVETTGETAIDSTTKVTETTSVETFTQNSTTASSVDSTETVIYSIPTTTEHFIDSTAELTEVTSKSQNPTSATKLTTTSQETSTSAELETSTNTQSPKITLITKTSASDVVTPSNEAVSETRPKTLTSNSVTNFPSGSFTSESMLESITAADIRTTFSKETAETESVDISSLPLTTKNFLDFTTEFTEVTSETQNPTFIPDLTKFTERTSSIITESETTTSTVTEPTINPSASENTDSVVVTETRTEASTPETVTEISAQTFPSDTTPDLHTESFRSETSSELSRTADTLSRQSTETESSTVSFASTITEQFIDSTTDFTEVTSRSQDLTSVIKFTASALGSSTIVTESEANNLMTTHSNALSTVSDIVTESRTETSSSDAVTVTQTKTVSPETASETSMHETVSNLRTDPFTFETAIETSSTGKTKVTSESTVTESVISSLPTTISLPTSVIKSTISFQGSSTNGSETHASTNMGTVTSTVETATSDEVTEASTESATLETMTEAHSKTSRSDLASDLPTESLISETVPQSTTVSEDQTQFATTHDTGPSSENGSSTITSVSMATGGFTDFTTELPDLISETGSPESITKFIVPSKGISNTVTDSETNSPMITQPITITSITRSTASAVATETRTESATPTIVTKIQTETPTSETESDIFTDSFKTETLSEMNSATESSSQYTTKSITGENTETESVSTSVPTVADQFIDSTTEFTEMTSERKNAASVTKFTATSQGPSGSVMDTETNTSATLTSTTESITSAVVTEILPESATPETVTKKRDEMSPETVTDFLTKSFTSKTIAESDKTTEDIAQYTTTNGITKNETETGSIAVTSKPTTAERLVDTTTETKKPVATKFTAPFERTSSTTAELEIDILTTEEQTSFISTGNTASTTVTETRTEAPNLGTITVSQEETVSDFPTKSFTTISERSISTENNIQYPTKIINTENTETETISILVPTTTERLIDSTIGFTDLTSKTENSTSVTKSTVTSQGFSSTITEPKGNISMLTEPTNTSTAGSTSAVVTEILPESATPEIVTETRGEISPETVTDFLTKAFTSETIAETENLTEDITQYTTTSSISKTETKSESISITSTPTTAERLVVTTTETEKPIVTKFTTPFERASSTTAESEIDMSTTEELSSFISNGSTASATVTETRSETPNIGTITVSQKETVSDLPTKSFTAVSEMSTPTENITQYTITSISTENTESESVSGSVPATTERLIESTTEFIEMTSKTEKATSGTKSTVTSQEFSSIVTKSEANISTITEPRTTTSTAGSTSAVITEIRTESATPESVTETGNETSPSETASDLYTNPVTPKTVTESDDSTEGFTQYTSSDIGKKETESITITSASTTTEQFIDSTTETKKPTVTEFTAPFERTSSITAESKMDISTIIEPTSFIFTTGSTTSASVTETHTGSAIPETVTETRVKTESDLFTKPVTTKSVSDSNTATESITSYTTEGFSRDNTETESVKISSVPTSTDRFVNSTTEFTEITSETHNPPSKFTAPSQQGSSSTATESETNISTTTEPNIVTSTAESTVFSVVTAFSTESATSRTMTETVGETSAFVTMSDLHTQPSTSETASESKYTTKDVTEYTTNYVSRKSNETEPATITTAATTAERFTDSTAEFTDVTSETKNSTETFVTKFTAYRTLSSSESTASAVHTSMNTEPVTKSSTAENSFETITVSPVETPTSETVLETRFQSSSPVTSSESPTISEVKESTTISTMCLDPNGMYPHPTNCQAFYKCTEGVPVLSLCVGDEHFNPRDHLCQDPCLALCDNTIDCSGMTQSLSSVTTEEFSTSANISTTLMTEATSYRTTETDDNASESSFIYTTNVSFPTNEQTDFTNEFSSTPSDNTISSTSIVSEVTAIEDNSTEIEISTLLTSPETFTSFPTTLEIAKTTLSDISSTRSSEETNNSPTSVFSTTRTGPSNFISTTVYDKDNTESPICQDPNGLYPNPNDCRSFIMCIGGEPYETQCDEQLHFSPLTQHCEFPCIAKCDPTLDCSTNPPIATSAVPFIKCPQKDFFPVYEQCDYYFDCVHTFPRIQTCPVGLTFNATTRVCDWPENAECGSSMKSLPESDDWYGCPCETCLVPSMSSCKAYYFCFNYKAYPMECSNGLLFDQSLNTCNYQSKTLCNIASSTTITTTSTTTAISSSTTQSYKCPERNGMFRDPSNCGRFIHCSNYWPYIKDCPGGLHFSVELQRCEWPCEAKCDLTLPCVATQQTPIPLRLPSTTPDPLCPCKNCRVSNPESCTKYIECTNGVSKRKNCPRGQTFDHQRQRCDWAHKVDCPYSQICPRSNGLFLYKDDCHKFVHCSNGIPYVKTCPGELEFDPRTLRCEWPSGKCVSAKPEFSSRAEEIDEQLFEEKWTCPEKFGYFPHETSCSKFYHCSFGTPHLKECSDDLSYNPLYQTCDWQKNVKCGSHQQHYRRRCRRYDRQILCPQNKTHVAHPHCDMFYDCSTGSPCPKRCPNGLFFNSITHMCDTAENVNCLKRDGEVYSLKSMAETCHRKGKGQMQDPANDSCFYKCHNHKVLRGCCSRNRIFNEKSNNCMLKTFIPQNLRIFG